MELSEEESDLFNHIARHVLTKLADQVKQFINKRLLD